MKFHSAIVLHNRFLLHDPIERIFQLVEGLQFGLSGKLVECIHEYQVDTGYANDTAFADDFVRMRQDTH